MKKVILLAIVFCITTVTYGQGTQKIRLGIKAGMNFSTINTKNMDGESSLLGYHFGGFLKVPLNSHFAIQPEILYTIKGSELQYDNSVVSGTATFTLDYVDIVGLAVFNITPNFNFHIGPYVGFLSKVNIKNDSDQGTTFDFNNELNKDDFEKTDMGIALGLGLDLGRISAGARYDYGLKTVGKEREFFGQPYTVPDGKNSVYQFYVALSIL